MNHWIIAKVLGALTLVLALAGVAPLIADWITGAPTWPWWVMIAAMVFVGGVLVVYGRRATAEDMRIREGLAITTLLWIVASLLAGISIWLASPATYIEGWFEAMSGLTTTGASVFGDEGRTIEGLSYGVLLWRALLHWMGGIGIVVISLALLPLLIGGSGFQLYRAEVPGLTTDRLAPRIIDTARILLWLYLGLTVGFFVALLLCGATPFHAAAHAMSTVATGGFSTFDNSVEGLNSAAAEWVIIISMFTCGLNFGLLLMAIHGKPGRLLGSTEARAFTGLVLFVWLILLIDVGVAVDEYHGHWHDLARDTLFQVVSICTSTGYGSGYDVAGQSIDGGWDSWPDGARMLLVVLMIVGGCAGSTAGGMKMARALVAYAMARRELRRYLEPARVTPIVLDGKKVNDSVVSQVSAFVILYALTWIVGALALAILDPGTDDNRHMNEAVAGSIACLSNIGPALGTIGAAENYHHLTEAQKVVCAILMLLGRLELFAVILTLRPRNWQR